MSNSEALRIAGNLVEGLLTRPQELQLFDTSTLSEKYRKERALTLLRQHCGKLVLEATIVDEYRLMAAYRGAGFHPACWDEVMNTDVKQPGWSVSQDINGFGYEVTNWPKRVRKTTHMDDEIGQELFTDIAPTTQYDGDFYITTREDLMKLFEYDYENLAASRSMDYDLLYERND